MNDCIFYIKPQVLAEYLMASYHIADDASFCILLGEGTARNNREAFIRWCERKVPEYEGYSPHEAVRWIELDLCRLAFDAGFMDSVPNPVTKPMDLFGRIFGVYRADAQAPTLSLGELNSDGMKSRYNVIRFPAPTDRR